MKKGKGHCTRRTFISRVAHLGLVGIAGAPLNCFPDDPIAADSDSSGGKKGKSRVVRLQRPALIDEAGRIDDSKAKTVIHESLCGLTGKESLKSALTDLFDPDERIGIKLNCLAGRGLSPNPPLVDALLKGLLEAGCKPGNLIVFERSERELRSAGFKPQRSGGIRYLGNDTPGMGYERYPTMHRSIGSCFCQILTREVDALINFGVLKDHNLSGVSVGLKNLFGLIHNPNKYHENNCDPYVADVADSRPVKGKLRLTLCDALVAQYHGGPSLQTRFRWNPGIFLCATDPVAIDALGASIIEEKRKREGLPSLEEDGRPARHIRTAASLGLGEDDLGKVEVIAI